MWNLSENTHDIRWILSFASVTLADGFVGNQRRPWSSASKGYHFERAFNHKYFPFHCPQEDIGAHGRLFSVTYGGVPFKMPRQFHSDF